LSIIYLSIYHIYLYWICTPKLQDYQTGLIDSKAMA